MGKEAIVKRKEQLPVKLSDLAKWIVIGKHALEAQIAKYKAIKTTDESFEAKQAILHDTQDFAEELLYAEAKFGEMIENLDRSEIRRASLKGKSVKVIPQNVSDKQSHYAQELNRHISFIAKVIENSRRKDEIPLRHHVLLEIQKAKPKPDTPELPDDIFEIIYADPPWKYGDTCENGGVQSEGVDKKYPVMSISELCELNILNMIPDNAVLFLWVTSPILSECFDVIKAWGFNYKASFVWDKVKHNMGHYNSVRHEFLLICTRGTFLPQNKELHDSVVSIERTKHSEKPEYFRQLIDKMYPKGKRIELFARKKTDGWDVYGNDPELR